MMEDGEEHERKAAELGEGLLDTIASADPEMLSTGIDASLLGMLINSLGDMLHSSMLHYQLGDHGSAWKAVLGMAPPIVREHARRLEEEAERTTAATEELRRQLEEELADD